jgi:hypothetical protein
MQIKVPKNKPAKETTYAKQNLNTENRSWPWKGKKQSGWNSEGGEYIAELAEISLGPC